MIGCNESYILPTWHKTVLEGLDEVERLGYPGTIVMLDRGCTQPILTDEKYQTDIVIAGAVAGEGKLIAMAHTAYADTFIRKINSPLNQNIQKWLVGGPVNPDEVYDVTKEDPLDSDALASAKIVVWAEKYNVAKSEKFMESLHKFVTYGGGIVIGATMWGHLQGSERTLAEMSTNRFLVKYGLYFTNLISQGSGNIKVSENMAAKGGTFELIETVISQIKNDAEGDSDLWHGLFSRCFPFFPLKNRLAIRFEVGNLLECSSLANKDQWPVKSPKMAVLLNIVQATVLDEKLPGIQWFPGDFVNEPEACSISISMTSIPTRKFYPTGYYAPAGKKIIISGVVRSTDKSKWSLMIGSHTDVLDGNREVKRWRKIYTEHKIPGSSATLAITSRSGGLIYLVSPMDTSQIHLKLHDVVEAPYFNLNDPKKVANWDKRRMSAGLWSDLCGKFITFTVPSNSIRDLEDPARIIEYWDSVFRLYYDLKGGDVQTAKKEWIVFDIQPSRGYMHAGHPIVATMVHNLEAKYKDIPEFALNYDVQIKRGDWGLYHELGQNVQEKPWTFHGTGEVTCNVFVLYGMEMLCKILCFTHDWLGDMSSAKPYLNKPVPDFAGTWKSNHGMALIVYAQLAHHFGWDAYKKVFRLYQTKNDPNTDQEKIDQWVIHFSNTVGKNLAPLFEFWAIPFSDDVRDKLKSLPSFLPDDKIVRMAEERAAKIRNKYSD